ncbi:MAG: cadmium-translocating P-type ATPase [Treponema sp.]|jgi:Cd2+/Zn2+-exporting ATPase|nr:cadmium-translocating P-type ATPase [Treponema sp.]
MNRKQCASCGEKTVPVEGKMMKRAAVFALAFICWLLGFGLMRASPRIYIPNFDAGRFLPLIPFIAAYLLAGVSVLKNAVHTLLKGHTLDENFLMAIASLGAFAVGEWAEAVGVMLFYMIGEILQDTAVNKSRSSIDALLALKPDSARVRNGDGWVEVSADSVAVSSEIQVRAGERIPLDGIVLEGSGSIDAAMLSGESNPLSVTAGDEVHSGTVSLDGVLTIRSTKTADNSSAAKIIELIEQAREAKAKPERFITVFARYYTPAVVVAATLLAIVPPLLFHDAFSVWIYRALTLLVISCPCALVVSIPLGYFAGIGGLSRRGIMIKGAAHLDTLAGAEYFAFDKTGTLTRGQFSLVKTEPADGVSETMLLETAARAERDSNHPIAKAIMKAVAEKGLHTGAQAVTIREIAGHGVVSEGRDGVILAGNQKLLEDQGIPVKTSDSAYTSVYIAKNGVYYGRILIGDTVKPDAAKAIAELKRLGIKHIHMFTGDMRTNAEAVAEKIGVTDVHAELLPQDKITAMEALMKRGTAVFVGDGINDAPVLARADAGIGMGSGADVAVEAADIILMGAEVERVPEAVKRSRKIRRVIMENIYFALTVKALFITLAVFGSTNMWFAIFADVGVALLAILNASRTLR